MSGASARTVAATSEGRVKSAQGLSFVLSAISSPNGARLRCSSQPSWPFLPNRRILIIASETCGQWCPGSSGKLICTEHLPCEPNILSFAARTQPFEQWQGYNPHHNIGAVTLTRDEASDALQPYHRGALSPGLPGRVGGLLADCRR